MSESVDPGWLTWANLITVLRLALLPVFFWLLLSTNHRSVAAGLLAALGATDWIDGYVARRFHQVSNVGKMIDPTADRVLVIAAVLGVALVGAVPWWLAIATLVRELLVSLVTVALALVGAARINVLWWGKVSTFVLMTTFPLFLLTTNPHHAALHVWQIDLRVGCWISGVLGLSLSWLVLVGYVKPARAALRARRQGRRIL